MKHPGDIFDTIGIVTSMISNFPSGLWNVIKTGGKEYTSILEFIVDLSNGLGYGPMDILSYLVGELAGAEGTYGKIVESLGNTSDILENADQWYQSGLLMDLETAVKYVIGVALASIPSCSANLIIGDKFMDPHTLASDDEKVLPETGISIPLNEIDPFNYLRYCPLSNLGKGFYEQDKDIKKISELYRSNDLNAFLWYCKNRSDESTQKDINKMMWDNRFQIRRKYHERDDAKWEEWLNSKKKEKYNGYDESKLSVYGMDDIKPIMQLRRRDTLEPSILVQISSQSYYRTRKIIKINNGIDNSVFGFNRTLFEFNIEYLNNIRIFSLKNILCSVIDSFFNGGYYNAVQLDVKRALPENMIKKVIEKTLSLDETELNDCYFSFSNDEYNDMLESMEAMKYSGKKMGNATDEYQTLEDGKNEELIENLLNDEEDTGSLNEEKTKIMNTFHEMTVVVEGENVGTYNSLKLKVSETWLKNILEELVINLISPIFSPKVLLIIDLNYKILGGKPFHGATDFIRLNMNIILSLIKTIVEVLIKTILKFLLKALYEKINMYEVIRYTEIVTNYILMLSKALASFMPMPDYRTLISDSQLDYVNRAEITPEKSTPDSKTGC